VGEILEGNISEAAVRLSYSSLKKIRARLTIPPILVASACLCLSGAGARRGGLDVLSGLVITKGDGLTDGWEKVTSSPYLSLIG
jgi:hypothetical protein